ncbi:hypothetical protein AAMO2058_001470800 [Amorphochlora amoebiformis]
MVSKPSTGSTLYASVMENSMAILSVVFLIGIAASKTILTKAAFKQSSIRSGVPLACDPAKGNSVANFLVRTLPEIHTKFHEPQIAFSYPIILSGLSCLVTDTAIVGVWGTGLAKFAAPKLDKLPSFVVVTVMTALGMAFQNLALNLLSVALQQALRATLPVCVVLFERAILGKTHNLWIYVSLLPLMVGPMLCVKGSHGGDISMLGLIYMSIGVLMSALKVVYLEKVVRSVRKDMGMVSFLFWLDLLMIPILAPWAVANGEVFEVHNWAKKTSAVAWGFLVLVSIMGGFRAYSINLVVKYASALTKTAADIFTQALTIYVSLIIFNTKSTPLLHTGIAVTVCGFAFYTYIKYLEKLKAKAAKAKAAKDVEKEPFLQGNSKAVESI